MEYKQDLQKGAALQFLQTVFIFIFSSTAEMTH